MGRGRAKAKQTKVARELKYTTTGTDLERLKAELASGGGLPSVSTGSDSDLDDAEDDDLDSDDVDDEDDVAPLR